MSKPTTWKLLSINRSAIAEPSSPSPIKPTVGWSRRELLARCGLGVGSLALGGLLQGAGPARAAENPLYPKQPHFAAKAKRVIHLFMNGGPSQVDTFDPKPELQRRGGEKLPSGNLKTERPTGALFPSPYKFARYGQSGIEVSEIFSHVGQCVDDMAIVRSMHADVPNHEPSLLLMNCGEARLICPSVGSWSRASSEQAIRRSTSAWPICTSRR